MPYETSKQEKFAYGLSPRKFRESGGEGRAITDEEWGQFPELSKYRDTKFVHDPEEGVMARDAASGDLMLFREMAADAGMSEEQWAAFDELVELASSGGGGVAAEDPRFFQRLGDLFQQLTGGL